MEESHLFALFVPQVSTLFAHCEVDTLQTISDVHIAHRIQHVLRLARGTPFIIFDSAFHIECIFESGTKKAVTFKVKLISHNKMLQPAIICMLPLLKKEALELAVYSLTELGASKIVLMQTQKSHNRWDATKDRERLERIMQAAAEQSKNFAFPELIGPMPLSDLINTFSSEIMTKIFFDCEGMSFECVMSLQDFMRGPIVCALGPEGDLTGDEKELLKQNGFIFCKLTPTILRAHQAVTVGVGMLRTFCAKD